MKSLPYSWQTDTVTPATVFGSALVTALSGRFLGGLGVLGLFALLLLDGRQHHHHVAAVLLRGRLDDTEVGDVVGQPLQQPEPQLGAGLFAAAEHDGDLDLVAALEEAGHVALLRLVVVGVDLRPELLLLDHRLLLVPAGLTGLLGSFVLELAEVHELRHRGACLRGDLDQVETGLLSQSQCVFDADDANLLAVRTDEPNFGHADALVDARVGADGASLDRFFSCCVVRGPSTPKSVGPHLPLARGARNSDRARGADASPMLSSARPDPAASRRRLGWERGSTCSHPANRV